MSEAATIQVRHRCWLETLRSVTLLGGADLVLTSPPYPDARSSSAYGAPDFDTSVRGYRELGSAIFDALKPGGVCVLNIDGPVRKWRPELGESERSLIAFKVAIDWAETVGFRYIEHCAYGRRSFPASGGGSNPRWRSGFEPVHVFSRPGAQPYFDRWGYTRPALTAGRTSGSTRHRHRDGWKSNGKRPWVQASRRCLMTVENFHVNPSTVDTDHPAPFSSEFSDAYVLCYAPKGGLVVDPFVGSGTVAFSCLRHGRRFFGGDLGHRNDGTTWADVVNRGLSQTDFGFSPTGSPESVSQETLFDKDD